MSAPLLTLPFYGISEEAGEHFLLTIHCLAISSSPNKGESIHKLCPKVYGKEMTWLKHILLLKFFTLGSSLILYTKHICFMHFTTKPPLKW